MPNENLNVHLHNAGWFRQDWNYYTDASVDAHVRHFNAAAADGISSQEIVDLLNSAADDFDQITQREARQIFGNLERLWGKLDDWSRPVAQMLTDRLNAAYPGSWEPARGPLAGEWVSAALTQQQPEHYSKVRDYINIQGDQVRQLVGDVAALAEEQELARRIELAARSLRI